MFPRQCIPRKYPGEMAGMQDAATGQFRVFLMRSDYAGQALLLSLERRSRRDPRHHSDIVHMRQDRIVGETARFGAASQFSRRGESRF